MLRDMLITIKHQTTVELDYTSEPQLKKKGCPFTGVVKVGTYKGTINKSHRQAELDAIEAKGTGYILPHIQARKWGHRIDDTCLIHHGEKYYVEVTEVDEVSVIYLVDGVVVPTAEIQPWLQSKQEFVSTRDFDLDKITRLEVGMS